MSLRIRCKKQMRPNQAHRNCQLQVKIMDMNGHGPPKLLVITQVLVAFDQGPVFSPYQLPVITGTDTQYPVVLPHFQADSEKRKASVLDAAPDPTP